MSTPLNLTLKRESSPSVWEESKPRLSYWRLSGVVAAALLAGLATRPHANRRRLIGAATAVAGASLFGDRLASTIAAAARRIGNRRGVKNDNFIDRVSEESFPASDAPQYL
jgi:hypothetical protein